MSSGTLSSEDKKFVAVAGEAGAAEVDMAKIAIDHGASVEVKNFANRMVKDHEKAGDELKTIASKKQLDVQEQPSKKDQSEIDKIGKLQGASFDRAYVKAQLSAHKDAVALFEKESKTGKDSDLKQFAAKTLPTLQDHLRSVEQLSQAMSKPSQAATDKTSPKT